jgi:predicted nucleotidyltransferase
MQAHDDIDIVYRQEKAHWEDRNADNEFRAMQQALVGLREAIGTMTGHFSRNKVPLDMAQVCYDEYERIYKQEQVIANAHLDNSKKRKGYEGCIEEYTILLNHCYRINQYCEFASHYPILEESLK